MTEWASTLLALVIGAALGLFMGAGISGDITKDWIKAGAFEFGGTAYRVERLAPSVAEACTHYPSSEVTQ